MMNVGVELRAELSEEEPMRTVRSAGDLDELLSEAADRARAVGLLNIIILYAPNDDNLSLVVGGDETVVGFNYGHGNPPYYASLGTMQSDEPVLTAYVGLQHHTEFLRRWVIPMELGCRASMEFLATGARPTLLTWEEV